jgi:hypothetical protein
MLATGMHFMKFATLGPVNIFEAHELSYNLLIMVAYNYKPKLVSLMLGS